MKKRERKIYFKFLTLAILMLGFLFFSQSELRALSTTIVINEIMVGSEGAAKREFIELYNASEQAIDLTNYSLKKKTKSGTESNLISKSKFIGTIEPEGFFVIAHPDYESEFTADLVYSSSSYYISNNYTVILYNPDGEVLDLVGYGEAGESETSPAINPGVGESIERIVLGEDSDDNSLDFALAQPSPHDFGGETPSSTPECGNNVLETGEECDDGNTVSNDGCDQDCQLESNDLPDDPGGTTDDPGEGDEDVSEENKSYKLGALVINELVVDPGDGDSEWVEIFNTNHETIDLDGWHLLEGSGAKTELSGDIKAYTYIVITKLKGNLNNSGDIIELRDNGGVLIDKVTYGNWDDGNTLDNAPVASDPYSIARKIDGHNSYNNASDFVVTKTLTKGKPNLISLLEEEADISSSERQDYDYSNGILISEIFPNPIGKDDGEFIELYNNSDAPVNLNGWRLGEESKRRYTMKAIINTKEYYLIKREDSKIALNNSFDTVKLFMPLEDKPSKEVKYEKAKEGQSYNCVYILKGQSELELSSEASELSSNSGCLWSDNVTPGKVNKVEAVNHQPSVDFDCPDIGYVGLPIIFDSSDTIDEDGDTLRFSWDFGDGATNTLAVPEHTYFKPGVYTVSLVVSDGEHEEKQEKLLIIDYLGQEDLVELIESGQIIISELLPNPEGADQEGEWIELFNAGDKRVNLRGWQIDDAEGGSRPFTFLEDIWLEAGAYYLLDREETGLALNNSGDMVRIINNETVVDAVTYSNVKEGAVYALDNSAWSWSSLPTPGSKNTIKIIAGKVKKSSGQTSAKNKIRLDLKLEQLKYSDKGDLVRTRGTVAVLPGVFGSQYFYIVGSPGVQVYSYKKDFPALSIGDYIEVSGEISELNGEKRIKTSASSDIINLEKRASPEPKDCNCAEVNESYVGQLIKVQGEVVEQKSSSLYIDDGTDEQLIYIKTATGINPKRYKEGDKIAVTGILSQTKSGVRLLPRSDEDIVKLNYEDDVEGRVLGEVSISDEWSLPARNKQLELLKYLLIIAGTIIIILGVVIFRFIKKKA